MAEQSRPTSVLDGAALQRLRDLGGGDSEFVVGLIDTFLDDAPGMLAEMRKALANGDAAMLMRAAHGLKSNSTDLGARALSHLCRELERIGKSGSLDGMGEKLGNAEVEYQSVKAALQAARDELG